MFCPRSASDKAAWPKAHLLQPLILLPLFLACTCSTSKTA
jgi:hypothetical protein